MKKACLWAIAVMFLVCGLGFLAQPSQAAYTPVNGDLIKTATDPAIYYVGADSKRHLYVNEVTFWTWYEGSWSLIKSNGVTKTITVLSQADFDSLEVGANAKVKPGVKLIKFQNSPKIYTSVAYGQLAPVPDDATAKTLFGDNWSTKIITIQNGFETDYTKDGVLDVTAGWNTYTNNEYGFEFQYPKLWKAQSRDVGTGYGEKDYVWFDSGFFVSVSDTSTYSFNQLKEAPSGGIDPSSVEEQNIMLDGITAAEVAYTQVGDAGSESKQMKKIAVSKNNLVYVIECVVTDCAKVIPTFKFTK